MCVRVLGKQGKASERTYHCFHTLTSQPAPQEGFFPEPSSSPSSPNPWLPGNLELYRCPWARTAADRHTHMRTDRIQPPNMAKRKERKGQNCQTRNDFYTFNFLPNDNRSHLQQAVANQRHQEAVAVALAHHGGVFGGVHAGEVEHGHVGLAIVVDGEVQRGQLVVGGEIRSLTGVRQQRGLVHVSSGQQQLRVGVVLPELEAV